MSRLHLRGLDQSSATDQQVPVWDNAAGKWVAATPAEQLLYDAKGDILIGSADNARSRLALGSNGQVLTADSTQTLGVKWATPATGYSDPLTTKGDLLGRSSSATSRLAVGSDGQILIADSAQTLGVKWGAAPSGSVATDTIYDAKGDIPIGTGADAAAKLTVGSNGQVLTADSTQSTGVKWATASGGSTLVGVKAYRSAAYSLATVTVTGVPWDAEEWDTDGFHDNSTNPSRFTVPTGMGGKYLCSSTIGTSDSVSGSRWIILMQKNGSTAVRGSRVDQTISTFPCLNNTCEVELAAGDYIEACYYQDSGGTRALYLAWCAFSMHKVG